jgi:predicted transposase/invertase (TIGR01784 family)
VFKDRETNETKDELSCVRLYFVEMPKLAKNWPDIRTALEEWVSFLNRAGELTRSSLPSPLCDEPAIVKAVGELARIGMDPAERTIYEAEEKAIMVDRFQLKTAEERGERRGREEGLQQIRRMVLHQMERRLGPIPTAVQERAPTLSAEELEAIGVALLSFESYGDLEAWFDARHP